jgi:ABC-2 type transport system ATP-binding protein
LWIRNLMKSLAAQGRTVIVSSHLMSEMEYTADHLIVIGRGRLIADCTIEEFVAASSRSGVRVRTPQANDLKRMIAAAGGAVTDDGDGTVVVSGLETGAIWDLASDNAVRLQEIGPARASLEQAFMERTAASTEFRADTPDQRIPTEGIS